MNFLPKINKIDIAIPANECYTVRKRQAFRCPFINNQRRDSVMASRIVLNTISYHGHGAIENIVPELTARGYKKAFV